MPKGSYSISFDPRPPEPEPEPEPERQATFVPNHSRRRIGILVAAVVLTVAVGATMWRLVARPRSIPPDATALTLPFSALIGANNDTFIVTSDSSLVLIQDLRQQQITLDDYITGKYLDDKPSVNADPAKQSLIPTLLKRRYTNAAETAIAGKIIARNSWASQRLFLRSGHGVQLSDFKNHNAILFGSPTSNPWARLFGEKLNFQFEWDETRRGMIRNRSPRPGEQSVYAMKSNPGESGRAYATIAFVPNVNGEGHVLLVEGTTAEGTEAAGEFITDDKGWPRH